MKGEDGGEMFEEGVVLARRYLGEGKWKVWDMRKDSAKNCEACSSDAERLVRHERGILCPNAVARNSVGEARGLLAQEAVAARAVRMAVASAPEPANGEDGGEAAVERDAVGEEEEGEGGVEAAQEVCNPRTLVPSKVVFLVCFVILRVLSLPSATTAAPPKKGCSEAEVEGVSAGRP